MKTTILFAVAALFVTVYAAQAKPQKEVAKVNFYGVDFSPVNVVGAAETDDKFLQAFKSINQLLVVEQDKYDIGEFVGFDISSYNVDHAVSQVDKLNGAKFRNAGDRKIITAEIIESYPTSDGNVLLFIAKELNKNTNKGTFNAVVFNGQTKKIISEQEFVGKAGGFGLRNFWAGSLYSGLKKGEF